MSEIPEVGIHNINIPNIEAPGIYNYVPHTKVYPFILNLGFPVVDMPGCVKYHPDAAKNREQPNLKKKILMGLRFFVMEIIQRMMLWIILQTC